ncbi:hypothetical protein THASP1DRAFT_21943 [Thamnocephalis sphaerospora]|uniref:Tag1-like fifth Ig-like domain-containing protein n=1 Tax=Thamnocephalis sphaerospora TaxID=78915 RepID=A0A4P9XXE0_9FUNG|nr:hypothetical protein THASP1DRAFT_21943 [Thamnocephalis sphaerospora]|eukprot:RKP10331.1 hypothetical protein THASP1DRAFT_21943 [Thamnocephalis sphaerospora]
MEITRPQRAHLSPGADSRFDLEGYEDTASDVARGRRSSYAASEYTIEQKDAGSGNRFFKTRRRMCLCICCLLMVIMAAVLIPVIIFVIVPAVAQSLVKATKMTITSANITTPQEDYFIMKMAGMVTDTGPLDAQIDIKDKVKLYYKGTELGQMAMEPMFAKAGKGAVIDSAPVFEVTNKEGFGDFAKVMIGAEDFTWTMKGEARVKAFGITLDGIKLEKDLTLKGMGNFPGVQIKSMDLPSNHPLGGIAMVAEASMGNPSPFGMELGDLTFDIFYRDVRMATANVTGVTIKPGVNDLSMKGRALPQSRAEDLTQLGDMFTDYMGGKPSDMRVVGVAVRPNATAKPISWLQRGFEGTTLKVVFDGIQNANLIQSLDLGTMKMAFTRETAWSPRTSAPGVTGRFKMPFGFPLEMKQISQEVTVFSDGGEMAKMSMPMTPAKGSSATGVMSTSLSDLPMNVAPDGRARFSRFVRDLAMGPSKSMTMQGVAAATASTAIGDVTIRNIKFEQEITIQGMSGLASVPLVVNKITVQGGTAEHIEIGLVVTMVNPANVEMSAGDIYFQVFFQGQLVGRCKIPNVTLKLGSNTVESTVYFEPKGAAAIAAGRKMLSDYAAGIENPIGVAGYEGTTDIESLKEGLSSIRLTSTMPALHEQMIRGARFAISPLELLRLQAPSQVDAYNPMDAALDLVSMSAQMFYKGASLGDLNQDFGANPVHLPPKTVTTTPNIMMKIPVNLGAIKAAMAALGGNLIVDVKATLVVRIGGYQTTLDYSVSNLPVKLVGKL